MTVEERLAVLEKIVALLIPEKLEGDDLADAEALLKGTVRCPSPGCRTVWKPGFLIPPSVDPLQPRPCAKHQEGG